MFTDGRTGRRTDGRTPGSSLYPRTFRSGDKKKIALNFPKSAAMDFFSKGLKNEFETARINEPSGFEPLKFYCIVPENRDGKIYLEKTQKWTQKEKNENNKPDSQSCCTTLVG